MVPFVDCLIPFMMNGETTPLYPQGEFQVWTSLDLEERRGGVIGKDTQFAEGLGLNLGSRVNV